MTLHKCSAESKFDQPTVPECAVTGPRDTQQPSPPRSGTSGLSSATLLLPNSGVESEIGECKPHRTMQQSGDRAADPGRRERANEVSPRKNGRGEQRYCGQESSGGKKTVDTAIREKYITLAEACHIMVEDHLVKESERLTNDFMLRKVHLTRTILN